MQIRGKEPCAELIRRQALRGSFSARNRQQRKAVAEVTEPDAPGVQHLAAPGVGAEAKQLVIEVQGDVITALQYAGTDAQVCLRLLADNEALLIAGYEGVSLWRTGEVIDGNIVFSPRGWSDFCPLKERALCQLP